MKFVKLLFIFLLSTFLFLGLVPYQRRNDQTRNTQLDPHHHCDPSNVHLCSLFVSDVVGNTRIPSIIRKRPGGDRQQGTVRDGYAQSSGSPTQFQIKYVDVFSPEERNAFEYAADIWAAYIESPVPIKIEVSHVNFSTVLAIGYAQIWHRMQSPNLWFHIALANAIKGTDQAPNTFDIGVHFTTHHPFYYGTNGKTPSSKYDFITIVLHEIGHGLGFYNLHAGPIRSANGERTTGGLRREAANLRIPTIYDEFMVNGSGTALTSFEDPSVELLRQFTSDDLFWDGANAKAANDENRPKIYVPTTWRGGASYQHLDDVAHPSSVMKWRFGRGESIHAPNPMTLGILEDMGWTINKQPMFTSTTTTFSVAENTLANQNIGTPLTAIDEDTDDTLIFSLRDAGETPFTIDPATGQLKTSAPPNYETQSSYTITAVVDDSSLEDTLEITINVTDVNDPPVFTDGTSTTREIVEGTTANRNIGIPVSATDDDGDTVTYTLSGTGAASFSIDATNGQLKTNAALNHGTQNTYTVTVTATSQGSLTDTISVTINIIGPVVFSNTALETVVRNALSIDANAPIYPDRLATLTSLTATDKGITDLTGLEEATGLQTLDLGDNEIVNLSTLSYLTSLQTLDLADNLITNVSDLSDLTALKQLDLRNNNVGNVTPLSTMTHLRYLYLDGNDNLSNLKQLLKLTRTTIDIDLPELVVFAEMIVEFAVRSALGFRLADLITHEDMLRLTTLSFTFSTTTDLTGLEAATNLELLKLVNNNIVNLNPLSGLEKLEWLELANNQIVNLSLLSGLSNLRELDLSNNAITDVSPLSESTNLNLLDLTGNTGITNPGVLYKLKQNGMTITGVDVPDVVVFENTNLENAVKQALKIPTNNAILSNVITTLTQLTATHKQIDDLTGLERATALTRLDLGNNKIDDLTPLQNLTSLTNLDLADNQIQNVSTLPNLTSLQTLDLTDNDIGDVLLLSTMTHLRTLSLRGNENLRNIKQLVKLKNAGTRIDITLPGPVNITDDNLEDALQTELGFQTDDPIFPEDMESLRTFNAPNLSINTLTGLEKATNLTTLNLSNNTISSISPLSRLTKLESLDLSENTISSISLLSGLTALTTLNLANNKISSVSSLSRLTSLETLDLSDNTISSLSTLSKLIALTALDLADNRITDVLALQGLSSLRTLDLSGNDGLTMEKAAVLYKLEQVGTNITLPQGITLPARANIVVFNNAALEAAVRTALRIRTGYPILTDNITDLTSLTATSKQIDDLTGLEEATALTRLDLGNNAIAALVPLQNLTSLTNLDLADNQIETLTHLQNLTNLTNLDLDNNQINNVSALASLTSLTNLDLRSNDVSDVAPLRDLTNLRYIYLNGNENLTNLEWLGALENLRSDIQLPDVVRLPDANLDTAVRNALRNDGNSVSNDLPMSEELLESLTTLSASNQDIKDLTGSEYMTALTSLDLRNNQINDVSPLSRLYSLETLRLDGNPILDTSVLRELQRRGTNIDITIYRYPSWDVNQDGRVDETDVFLITATITNESPDVNGDGNTDADDTDAADANKDGSVDTDDILLVFEKFNRPVNLAAPLLNTDFDWEVLERIDTHQLRKHLAGLRAENDGTLKYQKAITFLQAVLTALKPNQTLLLANYPNPFNPETWIPYQLARSTDVWITIYNAQGAIIRKLTVGYRPEGYYRVPGRAAHWDGRNDFGERAASGIYFYQLETSDISFLRKMVILK